MREGSATRRSLMRGKAADILDLARDDVYKPLHFSAGGLTTIRTENSSTGAPAGYYGMFFNKDDVAKIGSFLNSGSGVINGKQILVSLDGQSLPRKVSHVRRSASH